VVLARFWTLCLRRKFQNLWCPVALIAVGDGTADCVGVSLPPYVHSGQVVEDLMNQEPTHSAVTAQYYYNKFPKIYHKLRLRGFSYYLMTLSVPELSI
jgi:hypothetical protein